MKMKELNYSFVLHFPEDDNDGKSLYKVNVELCNLLIDKFGGLTESKAKGFWKQREMMYADDLYIFKVSSAQRITSEMIEDILQFCFDNTNQKAFYFIRNGVDGIAERG